LKTSSAQADPRGWNYTNLFTCNALACSNLDLALFGRFFVDPKSMHKKAKNAQNAPTRIAAYLVEGSSRSRLGKPCEINLTVTEPRPSGSGFLKTVKHPRKE
jgi:hypothetical protein